VTIRASWMRGPLEIRYHPDPLPPFCLLSVWTPQVTSAEGTSQMDTRHKGRKANGYTETRQTNNRRQGKWKRARHFVIYYILSFIFYFSLIWFHGLSFMLCFISASAAWLRSDPTSYHSIIASGGFYLSFSSRGLSSHLRS
jgi:hypothetical protein